MKRVPTTNLKTLIPEWTDGQRNMLLRMLEEQVIGEDEKVLAWRGSPNYKSTFVVETNNRLRAEQRKKLRRLFNGKA